MAKKNSTKTATKEALQASEPRIQTFSQWSGMYIKESPYGWTTDYEFEHQEHVQNQTDLKPNFLMIQDNVVTTTSKSLETRNETLTVSTAPHGLTFTGVTCLNNNMLYAAFDDGSIRKFDLDDAPHNEADNIALSKWQTIEIIDPDSPSATHEWTSINAFLGRLICFTKDADTGVGEIFSGEIGSGTISSAVRIPDPRGYYSWSPITQPREDGVRVTVDQTPTVINNTEYDQKYDSTKLYIRDSPVAYTYSYNNFYNIFPKTVSGYYQAVPGETQGYLYKDAQCTNAYTRAEIESVVGQLQPNASLYKCAYDISSQSIHQLILYTTGQESDLGYRVISQSYQAQTVELPHRLQFCYTYSNKYGQTLASTWRTVYANMSPLLWNQNTGGAIISQTIPDPQVFVDENKDLIYDDPLITDFNITGVDIYQTKDDSLEMIFCGHIEKTLGNATNTLAPGSEWKYIWYGDYADLSEWTNVSLTVPTENTTKGVNAAYMKVYDNRCYFFGGSLDYRLYIGGRVGNELCIATGVGGGYTDIEPGSDIKINNVHKFKTYNGANIVTIMCGHPNTHMVRRFNLNQINVSLTNELSVAGFMTEEVSNVVGCLSHHGSGVWADGLYTLSRYGLAVTTQQMENSNNLRAMLVSDAIQPIFTEQLASALDNTQMIYIDDVIYFALSKGDQYLNCGLVGRAYSDPAETGVVYYVRDEFAVVGTPQGFDPNPLIDSLALSNDPINNGYWNILALRSASMESWVPDKDILYYDTSRSEGDISPVALNYISEHYRYSYGFDDRRYLATSPTGNFDYTFVNTLDSRFANEVKHGYASTGFIYLPILITLEITHRVNLYASTPTITETKQILGYRRIHNFSEAIDQPDLTDEQDDFARLAYSYFPESPGWVTSDTVEDWLISYTATAEWINDFNDIISATNADLYYHLDDDFDNDIVSAQGLPYVSDRIYYSKKNREDQFEEESPLDSEQYYKDIFRYYVKETTLDDIIFAYDINAKTWYTFTYQPNLVESPIVPLDDQEAEDGTYSEGILSLINLDSQVSPEGIGIVTSDRVDLIPTAGIVDNAPSYIEDGSIAVPNYVATIETGELSIASPPQSFFTLSQLEFRFDYFFGDIDIDIEGVDYYGRTFHIHKDVTYDTIQQDLAVYVRVDHLVNTYNLKIKGRAHFRLTHIMAKVYAESRKINLVYGFDDSAKYRNLHGGTKFTHHYIKDYNNLRRALEP